MHIRVAGLTIRLTAGDHAMRGLRVAPAPAYEPFLVAPSPADLELTAAAGDTRDDGARECLFDSGGPWQLYRHEAGFLFRCLTPALGATPYKIAHVSNDFTRGRITLHHRFFADAATVDPLEYPLDELLFISLLGRQRGIEIHGCGVSYEGKGFLFVGQSGAGKSTTARLWAQRAGADILSDDRVILREEPDGCWIHGTPWHGEAPLASPGRAPLTAIYFLRQAAGNRVASVGPADAVSRLVAASFPPFYDAEALRFTLDLLGSAVSRTFTAEFGFAPTPSAVDFILQTHS